ncbi:MAG: type II secretion system protein GspH [Nitrospirae bacterium]|nr:type II secretion system protein GspH [Nitrospirota bacterium]
MPKAARKGFTLIELVLVLFVIGIASALAVGILYRSMDNIRLKTSAKELSASLRYARSHAVAEKKIYSFVMNKNGYGLYTEQYDKSDTDYEKTSLVFQKILPQGIIAEYQEIEDIRIDFYPQGDSTGGEIKLKNEKGSVMVITVEKITGKVKIEK